MNKLLVILIAPVPSLSALISEMIGEGQGTSSDSRYRFYAIGPMVPKLKGLFCIEFSGNDTCK